MNLATLQQEFMAQVFNESRPLPTGWGERMNAGLAIYRSAYRARLLDALHETFPKTAQWAGAEAFEQAAAHHVILHPPSGFTLDLVGEHCVETLADLFSGDPEVSELAWLEWSMHLAFTAHDATALDTAGFGVATQNFSEMDWVEMRISFVPSLHCRTVSYDCVALWNALAANEPPASIKALPEPKGCLVWRDGHTPAFKLIDDREAECVDAMMQGASFGDICIQIAAHTSPEEASQHAGRVLGNWLSLGLIHSLGCDAGDFSGTA